MGCLEVQRELGVEPVVSPDEATIDTTAATAEMDERDDTADMLRSDVGDDNARERRPVCRTEMLSTTTMYRSAHVLQRSSYFVGFMDMIVVYVCSEFQFFQFRNELTG